MQACMYLCALVYACMRVCALDTHKYLSASRIKVNVSPDKIRNHYRSRLIGVWI